MNTRFKNFTAKSSTVNAADMNQLQDEIINNTNAINTVDNKNKTVTTKTALVSAATSYISSGTLKYVKNGNVVTFSVKYTMSAAVQTSLNFFSGLPAPVQEAVAPVINASTFSTEAYDAVNRKVLITTAGAMYLKGAHTSGQTYVATGSYISAS